MAAAAVLPIELSAQAASKPNFVYIMADDLGYADVSCYGRREYRTPNIDSLAAQGAKFMQAYANSAVCSPTRTAVITGRYQYRIPFGLEEPIPSGKHNDRGLPPEHPTLPSLLKKAGYGTTLIGKWHLGFLPTYSPLKSGYDHFWGFRSGGVDYFTHKAAVGAPESDLWDGDTHVDEAGYMTDLIGNHAVKSIEDYGKLKQPFLLSLHFSAPHWPWEGPTDEAESKRLETGKGPRPAPETPALFDFDGGTNKTYFEMVKRMDFQIGRVLKALETAKLANNTIVVFTSDNGGERFADVWPFNGRKTELLEGGLRIPAVVRWPAKIKPGTVTQQVAMSMDWMPTFLAAAGAQADPAYPLDGMNLLPQLQGGVPVNRKVYWRYRYNAQRAMRDGEMKWLRVNKQDFVFNVVEDPMERANLKDRMPDLMKRMMADFEAWNKTMLPEDPNANTTAFYDDELADHPGNKR
jgi:arylsulfatase A-like enzyme